MVSAHGLHLLWHEVHMQVLAVKLHFAESLEVFP